MKENNTTKSIFVKKKTRHGIRYLAESFFGFQPLFKVSTGWFKNPSKNNRFPYTP